MLGLSGESVLVLGLGVSGRSAANFCAARGARVLAADERDPGAIEGLETLDPGIERMLDAGFIVELRRLMLRPGLHRDSPAMRAVG